MGDGGKGSAGGEGTKELLTDLVTSTGVMGQTINLEVSREIRNKLSRIHHS